MKKLLLVLALAASVAASAQTFVAGADVGYLLDREEAYYTGRFGLQLKASESYAHFLDTEVGYADTTVAGGDGSLLPVTLNYRLQGRTTGAFGYYVGAGAGFARVRADGVSINGSVRLHDSSFAAQGFAGLTYQASPSTTLYAGAKYVWIDDVKLAGSKVEIGDDVALSAGLSLRF